jgi:hypothetical protein
MTNVAAQTAKVRGGFLDVLMASLPDGTPALNKPRWVIKRKTLD